MHADERDRLATTSSDARHTMRGVFLPVPAWSPTMSAAENQEPRPTVLSLYSGAGGLDLGFAQAGFELIWAIDSDEHAVATYRANLGAHARCGKLPADRPPAGLSPDVI